MGQLIGTLSHYWQRIQGTLFSFLEEELEPLTETQRQLIAILELVRIEEFIPNYSGFEGRPQKSRSALARAFIAKTVYNLNTSTALIERLKTDKNLRRICGWETLGELPSESTFSRAFAEFAKGELPQIAHEALISKTLGDEVILHICRDSTAIEAREKIEPKPKKVAEGVVSDLKKGSKHKKKGRPKKDEMRSIPELTRIERQRTMTLEAMLKDLPQKCDKGAKQDSKGSSMYWVGYKLHLDIADCGIPISAIVTSASLHDSQVAIPLATLTAERVSNCYDLMDSAYYVPGIIDYSKELGHVPLIDINPRRNRELKTALETESKAKKTLNWAPAEDVRYNIRTTVERANSRLKDEFGACQLRVRGKVKVACHLMFGVLVLAADQLIKLAQ